MFSAFNTFGRLGAAAGRTIAQQIAAMSPALWLEPSVTNGYQDSAGTTALTQPGGGSADPPVGLAIDLSQGAALGPELVTNWDFNTDTSWAKQADWTISGGSANLVIGAGFGIISQNYTYSVGKTYKVVVVASAVAGADVMFLPRAGRQIGPHITAAGTYVFYFQAIAGDLYFGIQDQGDTGTASIDSISVRELKGNHALQSTSTARPKLSARVNLLVGTATLATQSVTVTAAAHTIEWSGAGTITASGAYSGALSKGQTFTPSAGTLTLTVSGSVTSASLVLGSSVGTYQAVTDANTYDSAGFPLYWKFDGTDDALATGNIDLTGTDKVTVVAAVYSVATSTKIIEEFGANVLNSFACLIDGGSVTYAAASGNSAKAQPYAVADTKIKRIITQTANLASSTSIDASSIRLNGVLQTLTDSGSPPGGGAFGNLPLYIGSRGGSSLFLNGNIYALLIFPRLLTAAEIAIVERYVAQKSGVTL